MLVQWPWKVITVITTVITTRLHSIVNDIYMIVTHHHKTRVTTHNIMKKLGCLYLNQIRSLASSSVTHAHHYIHDPSLWSILIYPAFFSNFVSKLFSLSCASFSWSLTLTLSPPLLPPVFFSSPVSFLLLSSCHQFHLILFYLYSTNSKKHWNIILEDKDPGINPQQSYNALWANTWQQ